MATFYSYSNGNAKWRLAVFLCLFAVGIAFADDSQKNVFTKRVEAEFHDAQARFQANTNDPEAAWQFARACFDYADFAGGDRERADIANQGIDACRQVIASHPKIAAAHYYLAMDMGQLARTELFGALKLVREMEREFKTTASLDEKFDYAGPERNLGLLYRDAPGWPTSIGSRRKARDFLERAAELAPDYPENLLNLVESYLKWDEPDRAQKDLDALDALWPKAQKQFTGPKWERSWKDWTARRDAARQKLEQLSAPATSPKGAR